MRIGLNVDENLKTLFDEISSLKYLDMANEEESLEMIDLVVIDSKKERLQEYLEEYRRKGIDSFYKLDRSTIININSIQILDYKEEQIIFKNREYIYTSKLKLKELESSYLKEKGQNFLIF